ncbi:hypothetical protein P153DRAFT_399369 [Dothidotthia symphoricarpi CBS 119687]|uniref:Uncharacterized protein n=1 Tax=Dothidotthia symphoricarpi CBS 119687 TaxID=1392245 RepID=A0A6A6A625_9PLEO|nr:uncharacterized protein P153DRAFT_399369 [Dothidotthia symphoricarpi CBS 119687]KAF2126603.1 hypothetical protein P153DRAFT_399369 [Dothidotthia symphoricarpi CBS 119687]
MAAQEEPDGETYDPLIVRIESGIDYTRERIHDEKKVMQTTRFKLDVTSPAPPQTSKAVELLRRAHRLGYATQIYTSATYECYELGVPRPDWVPEGSAAVSRIHDPHWWVGRSAAAIKSRAGPHADAEDVKKAVEIMKRLATAAQNRTGKTKRQIEIDQKLAGGLRRQELGLSMCDFDDDTEEENGDDYNNFGKIDREISTGGSDGSETMAKEKDREDLIEWAPTEHNDHDYAPSPPLLQRAARRSPRSWGNTRKGLVSPVSLSDSDDRECDRRVTRNEGRSATRKAQARTTSRMSQTTQITRNLPLAPSGSYIEKISNGEDNSEPVADTPVTQPTKFIATKVPRKRNQGPPRVQEDSSDSDVPVVKSRKYRYHQIRNTRTSSIT